ncbi:MAG: NADPH dehydrogenase NamA [Ruminococcaceae bacterium]|jgi:NADPH2 dehydrogenase|nr:NADPH dehydrogenase NamA [Oscillospiraceae bacterium]
MLHTYESYQIKNLHLKNRLVMAPMCMYRSDISGQAKDFHRIHYGTRAFGGTGLIIQEATAVTANGRISGRDLGLWEDRQTPGLASIVSQIHEGGAKAGIQLAHAGRKCTVAEEQIVAPSSLACDEESRLPHELSQAEIAEVVLAFSDAARRAAEAGYDVLEIHAAHGYLIHEFLSPLSNQRTDEYGGPLENRLRFLQEIITAVRQVWPTGQVLLIRLSATDYLPGGLDIQETVRMVDQIKNQVDLIHLSSGGLLTVPFRTYPGYQVGFAETVRSKCQVPTIAVGLISCLEQVEDILGNGRADLVALGRELLRHPYWPLNNRCTDQDEGCPVPEPYKRAFS